MPIHDWARVDAGVFQDFHHSLVGAVSNVLNGGVLPPDHYTLIEPSTAVPATVGELDGSPPSPVLLVDSPSMKITPEAEMEFYRRRSSAVAVRRASDDQIVALVEVVSRGHKASRHALRSFVEKATGLLLQRVHLLIVDLHPPGPHNPQGIHGEIWREVTGQEYTVPPDKPLTVASYDSGLSMRAYYLPMATGDVFPDMPLFFKPGEHVRVPLEATYRTAFTAVPRRWRTVLERD